MIFEITQGENAASLFQGWQEPMIWACLQGVMGRLYGDSAKAPSSAMALLGDFCFLAGKPDRELILYQPKPYWRDFMIVVPENAEWAGLIEECCGEHAVRVTRYAMKKEPQVFDREKLRAITDSLSDGYALKMIDEPLFWHCQKYAWCRDWTAQYDDYAAFQRYGLGVAVMKDGEPVSGASSYSGYRGGIEIEIDTREDYRRRGLAAICGAKLILECIDRGWYPSWDAQNLWSVALAEKLGYHFDYEYTAYEVRKESV